MNPVRAKIVEKPEHYRWSSYPSYIGKEKEYKWVEYSWILSNYGNDRESAKKRYREYIEKSLDTEIENPAKNLYGQIILGGEEFVEKIRNMLKGKSINKEIAERKRILRSPSPEDIIKKVADAFGGDRDIINDKNIRNNAARKAAIYLVYRYSGLSNEEVGKIFGGIHYSAVSKVSARLKEELGNNRKLAKVIREIESNVKT